jgi:hypothetical protein
MLIPFTPRPSHYAGTNFKSKLEATWASFLRNTAHLYRYEPATIHFSPGSAYTPDFYVDGPLLNGVLEVKGHRRMVRYHYFRKLCRSVKQHKCSLFLAFGDPLSSFDIRAKNLIEIYSIGYCPNSEWRRLMIRARYTALPSKLEYVRAAEDARYRDYKLAA